LPLITGLVFSPTIGGGWIISNEILGSGIADVITRLKLRAVYGMVGMTTSEVNVFFTCQA